jgi:hypothetical protein
MPKLSLRSFAVALFVSAALASAAPAGAAPVAALPSTAALAAAESAAVEPPIRARIIAPHVALTGLRATAHPLIVHNLAAPERFALHPAPAVPITALPLVAPPRSVTVFSAFLPRLGLAALPDLATSDRCGSPRSGVILSELPTAPYTPMACERDLFLTGPDLPTSLVPSRNKNALYGSVHAPHSGDEDP